MDNAIQNTGHTLLYLSPYSHDLNPIKKKWAQVKAHRNNSVLDRGSAQEKRILIKLYVVGYIIDLRFCIKQSTLPKGSLTSSKLKNNSLRLVGIIGNSFGFFRKTPFCI